MIKSYTFLKKNPAFRYILVYVDSESDAEQWCKQEADEICNTPSEIRHTAQGMCKVFFMFSYF